MVYMPFQNQGPNAVDRFMDTRVRQQQLALSEQATKAAERRTALAERAQGLEEMATAWKVLPGGSPQRVELMNRFYGMSGGKLGPMKIPPVDAEKITQNVVGELSRLSADVASGRRMPQDLMRRSAELYTTALREIYAMPGYDERERATMAGAVQDIGRMGLAGIEAQGGTVEHGIRAGQTAGAQIEVERERAGNRTELENLKARNRRRENRQEARLRGGASGTGRVTGNQAAQIVLGILNEKKKANEGKGTQVIPVPGSDPEDGETMTVPADIPLTAADRQAALRDGLELVKNINDALNPVTPGEGVSAKRRRGATARAAEERVKAGQTPEQAAVGAAADEYGPGLVFGLPAAGETPPDAAAQALDDSLALWRAANPGVSIDDGADLVRGIMRDSGYTGEDGKLTPSHAEALVAVLRKYGLVK